MSWKIAIALVLGLGLGLGARALSHRSPPILVLAPPAAPSADVPTYETITEAAVYGAKRLYACSQVYECGGVIVRLGNGAFAVGPLTSDYAGDHVSINRKVPASVRVVATIHSHPCLPDSHEPMYFSPNDLASDIEFGEPGFLLNDCNGEVSEVIPAHVVFEHPPDSPEVFLTRGVVVGRIPVSGASVEPVTGFDQ